MIDVSVILVNYNTEELTRNCLKSIYEKTKDVNFDIWIVDNNSKDNSCEMIKNEFPKVKLIENEKNIGFGKANNLAIEQSNAKYVFLLNTDTLLINNAIKILFDFMESNENIGACGGNILNENGKEILACGELPKLSTYILRRFGLGFLKRPKKYNRKITQQVEQIIGADLMIRKSVLDKVGTFNPKFFLYMEELELQYRINENKTPIYYVAESEITHLQGRSSSNKDFRANLIKRSEFLYYLLCYKKFPKLILKILFSIYALRTYRKHPEETKKTIKFFWTEEGINY